MSYLPWALLFEWLFRLLGVLAFGPHMLWVPHHSRALGGVLRKVGRVPGRQLGDAPRDAR